ncbi:MAG: FkbM family methyltransferase [Pseudonocardiaceae bacterium]
MSQAPNTAEARTIKVDTDVGVLELPVGDTVMRPWMQRWGTWEQQESALVDGLLPAGGTFLDIGAHVGYYTVRAARRVGQRGAVIAVEPWPVAHRLLRANLAANVPPERRPNLTFLDCAAWDEDTTLGLTLDPGGNTGDTRVGSEGGWPVRGRRLAGVLPETTKALSVVKVDAQGTDHRALAGLAEVLLRDRPQVLCEFWPYGIRAAGGDPVEVLKLYRSWGFVPKLVRESYAHPTPLPGIAFDPGDEKIVVAAEQARGGFLTLWLPGGELDR